ncbi:flavodoxin [Desulfosporosinus sp. PR]|uniref:flavodoxin n=1 Tax=Candidatus Desulfosporosinus nitrosoreducens TaxID=3401928 RepID=UPI0027F1AFB2|nr:flavodoxin [Desulfosporosinus sp. PR]MDQ7095155.1 flavodoxin [Desulfosporosinus sp. PR]
MKTLILYYSYGGNTRTVAQMIQNEIGGDLEEIETVKPYSDDYNSVVKQGKQEVESGFMPEIKHFKANIAAYNRIVLGTPVWWYTFAPAVRTVLSQNDLTGKTIYPFVTNGGWLGHTFKDLKEACAGAVIKTGLDIKFDEDRLRTPESKIKDWLKIII